MEENKNKILNVPTLRFAEFTEQWKQKTFDETFSILSNNTLSRAELNYVNGNYKNIHYGDVLIKFSAFIDVSSQDVPYINDENSSSKLDNILLQDGDIIIADTAEDFTVGKATEVENVDNIKVVSGLHTIPCRPKTKFSPRYLGYYVNSLAYHNQLIPFIQGIKVSSISKNLIKKTFVSFPNLSEQEKIVKFLSYLDKKIETQNKIINKYKSLIKGISNHLLCEIEDYPTTKLSDILIEYNVKARQNNEYPILSSTMNGIFVQSEYFNKKAASEETIGYKKVPYGYCTYRSMSDTGEFRFNIQKIVEIGIVSPAYPVFTSVKYDMEFIAFYLNDSSRLRKQILKTKEGGTRFALPFSKLRSLTIPKITELQQAKIVGIYCFFSRKKELEQKFLLKLKEQKYYLLSKMFI